MKHSIEFTALEYQELIELVFLGEYLKTKDVVPENYKQMTSLPSTRLKNQVLSQASKFNSAHLIQYDPELEGQFFLANSDDLLDEYFNQ